MLRSTVADVGGRGNLPCPKRPISASSSSPVNLVFLEVAGNGPRVVVVGVVSSEGTIGFLEVPANDSP